MFLHIDIATLHLCLYVVIENKTFTQNNFPTFFC